MGRCMICRHWSDDVTRSLDLCAGCVQTDTPAVREQAVAAHENSRAQFLLPPRPPRSPEGTRCTRCTNACKIAPGEVGYCGVRKNAGGRIIGGDPGSAAVQWYHDPLPTNCVASWVCPASGSAGYPKFTDTEGPESGYLNLAVFYEACSFDCLFCQNWYFRERDLSSPKRSAAELADTVTPETRCICFFGGDPTPQIAHALEAARLAREQNPGRTLRICWETNGSTSRSFLEQMAEASLESGGCIKMDLKAWDDSLHRALCHASNRRTLRNFERLAKMVPRRPDPPLLVASTLLVPGYVDPEQIAKIAAFIASLDKDIPYSLLGFYPTFQMNDLPVTSRSLAEESLDAAASAGLRRVHIGNVHLLT